MVNTGSIPLGPSQSKVCLLIHPRDVLKSGPKARRNLRSGLNLEGIAEQSTDVFLEPIRAVFSGFPGHRRAQYQKFQKLFKSEYVDEGLPGNESQSLLTQSGNDDHAKAGAKT